jgi:hypothetical protein
MQNLLIILIMSTIAISVSAKSIKVDKVISTSNDRIYRITNNSLRVKVTLDCASFIHNLNIQSVDYSYTYYLSVPECWDIYDYIKERSYHEKRCIEYSKDFYDIDNCI